MYVTLNLTISKNIKTIYKHYKPLSVFHAWTSKNYRIINSNSNVKLPNIKRKSLAALL